MRWKTQFNNFSTSNNINGCISCFLKLIVSENVVKGNEGGKYNKMQINCNILKNKRIICGKRAEYIIY